MLNYYNENFVKVESSSLGGFSIALPEIAAQDSIANGPFIQLISFQVMECRPFKALFLLVKDFGITARCGKLTAETRILPAQVNYPKMPKEILDIWFGIVSKHFFKITGMFRFNHQIFVTPKNYNFHQL